MPSTGPVGQSVGRAGTGGSAPTRALQITLAPTGGRGWVVLPMNALRSYRALREYYRQTLPDGDPALPKPFLPRPSSACTTCPDRCRLVAQDGCFLSRHTLLHTQTLVHTEVSSQGHQMNAERGHRRRRGGRGAATADGTCRARPMHMRDDLCERHGLSSEH